MNILIPIFQKLGNPFTDCMQIINVNYPPCAQRN